MSGWRHRKTCGGAGKGIRQARPSASGQRHGGVPRLQEDLLTPGRYPPPSPLPGFLHRVWLQTVLGIAAELMRQPFHVAKFVVQRVHVLPLHHIWPQWWCIGAAKTMVLYCLDYPCAGIACSSHAPTNPCWYRVKVGQGVETGGIVDQGNGLVRRTLKSSMLSTFRRSKILGRCSQF